MSHDTPTVAARRREKTGTRYAQRLRNEGRLPGIIYGHKIDPISVDVDHKEIVDLLMHGAHVMNVTLDGKPETCLIKDLQFGFLGDNVIHVDFARVDLDEEVDVNVHLAFKGEPEAGKKPGAIVSHELTELEVTCKVNAIPEEIHVDLTTMEDTVLTVGDIKLPPGIETKIESHMPVVIISFVHEEEAVGEEVELEGAATPEVITESKKEDEEG